MPAYPSSLRTGHFALLLLALAPSPQPLAPRTLAAQDDPFAAGVRTTPWLSPAHEQKLFQLPPGFEINLVVAEPDIQKPLNMAFDERGRIWLTCTVEYPYAAPEGRPAKDSIRILEDTDGDGRYEKVTTFADNLNIPIGIYPWKGGCVAYSIPNIWHFEDTDADGICDKRTVLYGPFDTSRDTHGMVNSFRRGWDGWVYACHGFNNDSRVKGKDGHEIHMQSGNTFRFQLDGSRLEHFTHGQVNPFGMCFDELFNIFTADCHSKPVYQLLRGGHYPSFGKPHDGLGFVPPMMDHTHNSTAICGLVCYSGENFPAEYRGNFFSGNVMTSRINRNKPEYHGSTIKAIEQPDFLTANDPWFRPVDLQIGPDGALYIADFYNRIIGHYEVPLPHPGRDRTSGRIWRVTYMGDDPATKPAKMPAKFLHADEIDRYELLETGTLSSRLEAAHRVADRRDFTLANPAYVQLQNTNDATKRVLLLWMLNNVGVLFDDEIADEARHSSQIVRTHVMKILAERETWTEVARRVALNAVDDPDPFVARAAADALGRHPQPIQIPKLLSRLATAPQEDNHLRYAIRRAVRNHIAALTSIDELDDLKLSDSQLREVASVCLAVPAPIAADILTRYVDRYDDNTLAYLQHAARYATDNLIDEVARIGEGKAGNDIEQQAQVIQSLTSGMRQRDGANFVNLELWAHEVVTKLLTANAGEQIPWTATPIDGLPPSENPWAIAARPSRDGDKDSLFYYSLPKGEQRTGIYRSAPFAIPEKLTFWCAGHSGIPNQPLNDANHVRLRDGKTNELLMQSRPPRNDTARQFTWDLSKFKREGEAPAELRRGYIELIDGDTANAYAWLAVGRFSIPALNPSDAPKKQKLAAEIIGKLKLTALQPQLTSLITAESTDSATRTAIAQALLALAPDARASALVAALSDASMPETLRLKITRAIVAREDAQFLDCLREVMKQAPTRLQTAIADTLAGDLAGADALLTLIESGHAAPRLLLVPNVSSKLGTLKNLALDERIGKITAALPSPNAILDALITDRRRAFNRAATNLERGETLFTKHCAACHQLEGKGVVLGPQLDGIGNRGLDRLLEDLLDPNRNVDVAFRATTLRMTDGRILSGLPRREEGTQLILADPQGKEFSIAKSDIEAQQRTSLSLMPANLSEILPAEEFYDLLAYLLTIRATLKAP